MHAAVLLLLFARPAFVATAAARTTNATNVVLLLADDLSPDALTAYQRLGRSSPALPSSHHSVYHSLSTPSIASLATAGATFTRYYTPSPLCSPSRYAILSGRYPSRARRAVELTAGRKVPLSKDKFLKHGR